MTDPITVISLSRIWSSPILQNKNSNLAQTTLGYRQFGGVFLLVMSVYERGCWQ